MQDNKNNMESLRADGRGTCMPFRFSIDYPHVTYCNGNDTRRIIRVLDRLVDDYDSVIVHTALPLQ